MITKSEKEALKKLQKKGLSVSEENSPSATMGYTGQSRAALLPPGKNRELRPGGTMERVLANKLLQKKSPTGSPDVSPGSTLERKPALPPKRDTDPTSSKESIESSPSSQSPKLKSGGYMMQGRYIPPPPKRPPPKLKLDEPLPPLPGGYTYHVDGYTYSVACSVDEYTCHAGGCTYSVCVFTDHAVGVPTLGWEHRSAV